MRQIEIRAFGGPEELVLTDAPTPEPADGELLVQVLYAGTNPVDHKMRDGSNRLAKQLQLPAVLGREFVGERADGGGLVVGVRTPDDLRGTYAEQIVIPASAVAPVPASLADRRDQLPHLGGLGLAGLTALGALDQARVQPGDTVLVHGGTGGVGQLLVPLARRAGAGRVLATSRAENADRVRELGAEPVPHDRGDWATAVREATDGRGVDVVLDTHYHSTFVPSLALLASAGRMVVLPSLADLTPARERGVDAQIAEMVFGRDRLELLLELLADDTLPLEVSAVLPLAQAAEAHRRLETGHTRGKIVLDTRA
ncbi:NADP-dependent oxidoreductase [Brachybacterium sp. EF45031]|uniref:quinone oxidoreductase family protein n=1 Tax=Brachybacterium sillae TaxID=2810536 RepID=UPI00217ED4F0|nr:NADP-dependent oxidoreductase [Brachybacterium sillae]MCS6711397.1 NADP-dependent oxidoreductase [Brachybacterium sillae]